MDDSGSQRRRRPGAKQGKPGGRKRPKKSRPCSSGNLIVAMNHKVRRHVLRRLHRSDRPLSPVNLSDRMGVPIGNVSYHMGVLRKCGAVSLVDQRAVRGAIEHFFVSEVADDPVVQAMLERTEAEDEGRP